MASHIQLRWLELELFADLLAHGFQGATMLGADLLVIVEIVDHIDARQIG